jgi:phosphoglycerol transferase MdoB-like AlkP superfamily enzyme
MNTKKTNQQAKNFDNLKKPAAGGMNRAMIDALCRFSKSIDEICRQRQKVSPERAYSRSFESLKRLQFFFAFSCLSVAAGLLMKRMTLWEIIPAAMLFGIGFWTASLFFKIKQFQCIFLWIFGPFFSFLITEILIGNIELYPYELHLTWMQSRLNLVWYYMLAVLLYLVTGRQNLSSGIAAVLGWFWGNINFYIYQFCDRILFPADLLSTRTALSVTTDYDWTPTTAQWVMLGLLLVYLLLLILTAERKTHRRPHLWVTILLVLACAGYISIFFGTSFLTRVGIEPNLWYTQHNGVLLNFMVNLKYSHVEKPEGYSTDALEELEPEPGNEGETNPVNREETPNIIVVMNEAFSDLEVLGELKTNTDCMPFFHSLTENTMKGYAYSSVFGGNTANSEYEFLTGNTLAFLPSGITAYQLYVSAGDYSLVGQLNGLGYKTIAMHPYLESCWNRASVYSDYGFSETYFMNDYRNRTYIRHYISDMSNYKYLISLYQDYRESDTETPLFFFNVTMQNHGSYTQKWYNLDRTVYLTGALEGEYTTADQYLSLISESDSAFEMLTDYFSEVDDPTIILIFGDHQPNLGDDFYKSIIGESVDEFSTAETELMHMVPFALWANYDIEEQDGVTMSIKKKSPPPPPPPTLPPPPPPPPPPPLCHPCSLKQQSFHALIIRFSSAIYGRRYRSSTVLASVRTGERSAMILPN